MKENRNSNTATIDKPSAKASEAQYLPVPLACVPPERLNGIKSYISTSNNYSLYNNSGNPINVKDYRRLIEAGVKFMYISTDDYKQYYKAISESIKDIAGNKDLSISQKSEIICTTSIALAEQICTEEISDQAIDQSENMSSAIIKVIMGDDTSMAYLFNNARHDYYTETHMANVSTMMIAFGCKIGIRNHEFLNQLGMSGFLHDVGKIISQREPLDDEDSEDDTNNDTDHVSIGVKHLKQNTCLTEDVIEIISHHHEKIDGSGYPKGLKGDAISISSRMLAVVNAFEDMTSERPHRTKALPVRQALKELKKLAPNHLDEKVVAAFVNFIQISLLGCKIEEDKTSNKYIIQKLSLGYNKPLNPSGRIYPRYYFRSQGELRVMTKTASEWKLSNKTDVIIYNISQGGLGILSMFEFEPGQILHVTLPMPGDEPDKIFVAKAIRCMDYGDGWYTIGMEFIRKLTFEETERICNILK